MGGGDAGFSEEESALPPNWLFIDAMLASSASKQLRTDGNELDLEMSCLKLVHILMPAKIKHAVQTQTRLAIARRSQEKPGGARRSQGEPGGARRSHEEPGGARGSQEEPGGARRSQGEPGGGRGSQEEPGGARLYRPLSFLTGLKGRKNASEPVN